MGAQTVTDQVKVGAVVIDLVLDELQQVGQLGAHHAGVGGGNGVGGEVAPADNDDVGGCPQPQQGVAQLLDPDGAVDVVEPTRHDDLGLEHRIEGRRHQAEPVPRAQHDPVGVMRVEQLELGPDVAPVPGAHVERPVARMVELVVQRETANIRVAVVNGAGVDCLEQAGIECEVISWTRLGTTN